MRLSERDIGEVIGRNLLIYPFSANRVDSCTVDLTASKLAWSLKTKESACCNDLITCKPNDTVMVVTTESVALFKNLCGVCCSGVSLATEGAVTNTTPVKCGWIGKLIITIYNPTQKDITFAVNSKIAVLLISQMRTKTHKKPQDRNYKTVSLLLSHQIILSDDEKQAINDERYTDYQAMRDALKKLEDYKRIREKRRTRHLPFLLLNILLIIITLTLFISFPIDVFLAALLIEIFIFIVQTILHILKRVFQ